MDKLFNPNGIAVVGASANPGKAGYVAIRNMREKEYPGKVFPINPKEKEILGYPCYGSLADIEENVDLVVLIMPSRLIYDVMDDLNRRMETKGDVKFIVCAAADYAETKTEEGIARQKRLMETAEKYHIRVIGPNCIGVIDNRSLVDTTFVDTGVPFSTFGAPTGIPFISQSGALASAVLMEGAGRVVPVLYNKFISIGNMADIDFIDLISYLETDETTKVIGIYMEGYKDGKKLADVDLPFGGKLVEKAALKKIHGTVIEELLERYHYTPDVSARGLVTQASMAGSDQVYDAVFKQCGVIRVDTIDELIDTMQAFDQMPLPAGGNTFLLTQAGGPGIYCTDAICAADGLTMPDVSDETKKKLTEAQLPMANICHPQGYADITASASVKNHVDGLRIVLEDENVDAAVLVTVVPTFLPQVELAEGFVALDREIPAEKKKPVYYCVMAGAYTTKARKIMESNGLCTFNTPEKAVKAAANLCKYAQFRSRCEKEENHG